MMRKLQSIIVSAVGILVACAACVGQPTSPSYSRAELKKMINEAHTAEQFKALATYFSSREESYEQKAAVEKQEWYRLRPVTPTLNQRYPRPADASRNRYIYFTDKAEQMDTKASRYEGLAESAQQ
jgi:hypothetical protein